MDGDHRPGSLREERLDRLRCDQKSRRINVGQHWLGSGVNHGLGGGDEGHAGDDDLIALSHTEGASSQGQPVGARPAAGAGRQAVSRAEGLLEAPDLVPADKGRSPDHSVEGGVYLGADALVKSGEIQEGNSAHVMTLAGFPATVAPGATSLVTTAPAPIKAPDPTRTPGRRSTAAPMTAPASTWTACSFSFVSGWLGRRALSAMTPGPNQAPSSITEPSAMEHPVWNRTPWPTCTPGARPVRLPMETSEPIVQFSRINA